MNFINLTNGIEKISDLDSWSVVRIRSTTIERENWELLFSDLDHNLLFWLARGVRCHVYDFGTRHKTNKTIGFGIPLIKGVIGKVWFNIPLANKVHQTVYDELIGRPQTFAAINVKRKLSYYKNLLASDDVHLFGHSEATEHDGDFVFYRQKLAERNI